MAREISAEYVEQLRFPNLPSLHCSIKARKILIGIRQLQRWASPGLVESQNINEEFKGNEPITPSLESASSHFQKNGWAFVDNIFNEDFHRELISTWPKTKYFTPPEDLVKSFERGIEWVQGQSGEPFYLNQHPALKTLLFYLRSDAFSKRITTFVGESRALSCYSFLVNKTRTGSLVAPHRDTNAYLKDGPRYISAVFYINGSGGVDSGGLEILKDNSYNNVIFQSTKLYNSALFFDVSAPFYHGFRPVKRGKFRWAVTVSFSTAEST